MHSAPATAAVLAALGFKVDQPGASYPLVFDDGELPGKKYSQVRRKLNKAQRLGITVECIESDARFAVLEPAPRGINRAWLR